MELKPRCGECRGKTGCQHVHCKDQDCKHCEHGYCQDKHCKNCEHGKCLYCAKKVSKAFDI